VTDGREGRIVATLAPDAPAVAAATGLPRGVDGLGHAFSAEFIAAGNRLGDSTALLRVSRATGQTDTVTRLKALVARQSSAPDKNGYFSFSVPTIGTAEEALPFPDGWVAVVRTDPYRVDRRSPDARWVRGAAVPFPVVRMDEKEKRAYMERLVLPPNERVVSFGTTSVYVAVTDDDGIQRLRRHPWPPRLGTR